MFDGKAIREKRVRLKLSGRQLAKKLKVKLSNLYKWEEGVKPMDPEDYDRVISWLNDTPTKAENEELKRKYVELLERTNATLQAAINKLLKKP